MPTNPASLAFVVGPGSITQLGVVDGSAYGTLPASMDSLVKMGVNTASTVFNVTPPSVPGQSINLLVQASFLEGDTDALVLPYRNAANPSQPFAGPGGGSGAQNTRRTQRVQLQVKAGAPANAGSQATPFADAGWSPLWIVTVNAGTTSILAGNIIPHPDAPTVPAKLPTLRRRVLGGLDLYVSNQGIDSNAGTSVSAPVATIQRALALAADRYDLSGQEVRIRLAAGTYLGATISGSVLPGAVKIIGDLVNPGQVIISQGGGNAITAADGARLFLSGLTVTATGSNVDYATTGVGVLATGGSVVALDGGMNFGSCDTAHMLALLASVVTVAAAGPNLGKPYSISGSSPIHLLALNGSIGGFAHSMISISNGPNFSSGFVVAGSGSTVNAWGATFVGGATGVRYVASGNAVIETRGAGAAYLPGSTAGVVTTGGQYL